jgi:hypothetical protein
MMEELASEDYEEKIVMIGATYLKAHCTASSLRAKKGGRRLTRPSDRALKGRAERDAACSDPCDVRRPSSPPLH